MPWIYYIRPILLCRVFLHGVKPSNRESESGQEASVHLPLPARCCLTVCRILSSPPAGCSCSCPLPSQCRASANRDKKKILNVKKDLQQKQGRQPTGIKKLFYGRFRKERLNKRLNVFTLWELQTLLIYSWQLLCHLPIDAVGDVKNHWCFNRELLGYKVTC